MSDELWGWHQRQGDVLRPRAPAETGHNRMGLFLGLPARRQHGATEDAASSAYPVERQNVGQHRPQATSTKVNPWAPQGSRHQEQESVWQ